MIYVTTNLHGMNFCPVVSQRRKSTEEAHNQGYNHDQAQDGDPNSHVKRFEEEEHVGRTLPFQRVDRKCCLGGCIQYRYG